MDPIAHATSGALLGRAVRPQGEHWQAYVVVGTAAALSPDIDAIIMPFGMHVWGQWHQLFTHSLIGLLWVPLGLSLLPFRFAPWKHRFAIALAGWTLHIILDLCARWPVPIFWPLVDHRWALYLIKLDFSFVIDMLLVMGFVVTLWDPARPYARWVVAATALIAGGWLISGLPT